MCIRDRNNALYRDDNKIISDGALVAITLMIAESRPEEKDIMAVSYTHLAKTSNIGSDN